MPRPAHTVERIRATARGPEIPVLVHSAGSGPTTVVAAVVHGDEAVGFAAALALDRWLPTALRAGRVVLYPVLNPGGLAGRTRLFPEDHGDLNRHFPGDALGPPSARHCAVVFDDLAGRQPDLVLDLHADSPSAIPYALLDRAVGWRPEPAWERRLEGLARASGLAVILDYPPEIYMRCRLDRSLAGAAYNTLRCAAITLEVGPRRSVDPVSVARAVAAVRGILAEMGHVSPAPDHRAWSGPTLVRANAPRTRYAGVFVPAVSPGGRFDRGDPLGVVYAADGELLETLVADAAGVAVAWMDGAWVEAGGVPGALGLED